MWRWRVSWQIILCCGWNYQVTMYIYTCFWSRVTKFESSFSWLIVSSLHSHVYVNTMDRVNHEVETVYDILYCMHDLIIMYIIMFIILFLFHQEHNASHMETLMGHGDMRKHISILLCSLANHFLSLKNSLLANALTFFRITMSESGHCMK